MLTIAGEDGALTVFQAVTVTGSEGQNSQIRLENGGYVRANGQVNVNAFGGIQVGSANDDISELVADGGLTVNPGANLQVSANGKVVSLPFVRLLGQAANAGEIYGNTTVGTAGVFNNLDGGVVYDGFTNNGQTVNAGIIGGGSNGSIFIAAGTLNNTAEGQLLDDVTVRNGTLDNSGKVFGDVTVGITQPPRSAAVVNRGTIEGSVEVGAFGQLANNVTITGALTSAGNTTNDGDVRGLAVVNGGVTTNTIDGRLLGGARVEGGQLTNNGRIAVGVEVSEPGSFTNNGAVGGTALISGGTMTNSSIGHLAGKATIEGGELTNFGVLAGGAEVRRNGTLINANFIKGTVNSHGTTLNQSTGVIDGSVLVNAGNLTNAGNIRGDAAVASGAVFNNSGIVVGDLTSRGLTDNSGHMLGEIDIRGSRLWNTESGVIAGPVTVDGGVLLNDNEIKRGVTVESGILRNNELIGGNLASSGNSTNTGTVAGTTSVRGGVTSNTGTLSKNVNVSGGVLLNRGTIGSAATVKTTVGSNGQLRNTGLITGSLESAGVTLNAGTVGGTTLVTGRRTTNLGAGILSRDVTVLDGELLNQGRMNGNAIVATDGTLTNQGDLSLNLSSAGTTTNSGNVLGSTTIVGGLTTNRSSGVLAKAVTIRGGELENAGEVASDVRVGTAGTLLNTNTIRGNVTSAGTTDNAGVIAGNLSVTGGETTNLAVGRIGGTVTISGGTFENFGTISEQPTIARAMSSDPLAVELPSGSVIVEEDGTFASSGTIAGDLINHGTATVSGTVGGDITNNADFVLGGGLTAGNFQNNGQFNSSGLDRSITGLTNFANNRNININGGLTIRSTQFSNSGTINMVAPGMVDTNDRLAINGNLNQNDGATYNLDLRLSDDPNLDNSDSDQLIVNGDLIGHGTVNFNRQGGNRPTLSMTPVVVFDVAGGGDGTLEATGLPADASIIQYEFRRPEAEELDEFANLGANDWIVVTSVNPAAGGIAGSLALVESMVGTVVNRPNSAYIAGLAYEAQPNQCGPGLWSRATGGAANISGRTTGGFTEPVAEVDAYYGGYQAGADLQCFNLRETGWDIAVGGFGGFNLGGVKQSIEETRVDSNFDQYYAGGYVSASKGAFVAELQSRFDFVNYKLESPGLGLDTDTDSKRVSISATTSYNFALGDYSLAPTIGGSVYYATTDDVVFNSDHRLSFEDRWAAVGFASVSLARSFLNADKTAAYQPFITGSVYSDFGAETESTFHDPLSNVTQNLSSEGVGTFGEVSVGLNYLTILPDDSKLGRQLNATIRGDVKFSDRMLSGGGAVQLRLQF